MIWYVVFQKFDDPECEKLIFAAWQEVEFLPGGLALLQDGDYSELGFDLINGSELLNTETTYRTYFRERGDAEKYLARKERELGP